MEAKSVYSTYSAYSIVWEWLFTYSRFKQSNSNSNGEVHTIRILM